MYRFVTGCLRCSCAIHTLNRHIVTTRSSASFQSYTTLVRFRHYSDSLFFHNLKRPSLLQSRPNAVHSCCSHCMNPDPYAVIFNCVIRSLRSKHTCGVFTLVTHLPYSSLVFTFTFPTTHSLVFTFTSPKAACLVARFQCTCFQCSNFPLRCRDARTISYQHTPSRPLHHLVPGSFCKFTT